MRLSSIDADDAYDRWRTREPEVDLYSEARDRWDEDKPLDEVIDASEAYEILDLLLCDPIRAKARLNKALDDAFDAYIERCKDVAAEAAFDAEYDAFCY